MLCPGLGSPLWGDAPYVPQHLPVPTPMSASLVVTVSSNCYYIVRSHHQAVILLYGCAG